MHLLNKFSDKINKVFVTFSDGHVSARKALRAQRFCAQTHVSTVGKQLRFFPNYAILKLKTSPRKIYYNKECYLCFLTHTASLCPLGSASC